jgi:OmpA-OmpF porin, OOP family
MSKFKKGFAVLGLASAMLVAGPALAQDTGFYAGAHIGSSDLNGACDGFGAGVSCDEKDTAWKILGGYQFHKNWAVELGYANLGEASASAGAVSAKAEVTAWDLVAVGSLPLMDRLSAYGKLGMFKADTEVTSNVGVSDDDSETGFTFGLGVRYDFTRNLGVRAEWQRYQEVADDLDVDVLSVGVIWKF